MYIFSMIIVTKGHELIVLHSPKDLHIQGKSQCITLRLCNASHILPSQLQNVLTYFSETPLDLLYHTIPYIQKTENYWIYGKYTSLY